VKIFGVKKYLIFVNLFLYLFPHLLVVVGSGIWDPRFGPEIRVRDPGSRMEKIRTQDKYPESTTPPKTIFLRKTFSMFSVSMKDFS
jgi:hypothetical protein